MITISVAPALSQRFLVKRNLFLCGPELERMLVMIRHLILFDVLPDCFVVVLEIQCSRPD